MLNKFASLVLVIALVCTLSASSAFANTPPKSELEANEAGTPKDSRSLTKTEAQPNERLRADMLKLVADAKSGKLSPVSRPQIQPPRSNSLSKGQKIAIGVGIAVAVVAVIFLVARNKADDGLGSIRVF